MSRTERVTTPSTKRPTGGSASGPVLTRPRDGLSPTSPQCAAGMRMDPAMSLASAAATSPRYGGGRASRTSTGGPSDVPRVAGRPGGDRLGGPHEGHLGDVRAAQDHQAHGPEGGGQRTVGLAQEAEAAQVRHALVVGLALQLGAVVLQEEGDAVERTVGQPFVDLIEGPLEAGVDDGVDGRVPRLDGGDRRLGQLTWMGFAVAHESESAVASRSNKRLLYPPPHMTRLADLVGCRLPLQLAGMSRVAGPDLAAAVTNAGGLGMLGIGRVAAPPGDDARPHRRGDRWSGGTWPVGARRPSRDSPPPRRATTGDIAAMALYAGISVGAVHGVQPAADIVAELTSEHACYRPTT